MTWIEDKNGNKCSVEWFGSKEDAQKALDSLKDCKNCTNCSDCSRCSGCSGCSGLENSKPIEVAESLGPPKVPVIPDIHKAIYAVASQPDSLAMEDVHTCANTHCRGGWVITLAGTEGKALERFFNWELAAMKIYAASGYLINPGRFYDSNADALADMKRLAEL